MLKVWLIQQGVWNMPRESMPLAAGYLKAAALSDLEIRTEVDIELINLRGGVTGESMAERLSRRPAPDVVAFSVYGWNYARYVTAMEVYKSVKPDGWIIVGGPHVSYQGRRVLSRCPHIDIVVSGEGEATFCDLLKVLGKDSRSRNLHEIEGITFRDESGEAVDTNCRLQIARLDDVASPMITEVLRLRDENGRQLYDVAIMETKRGCPYECRFCYLGNPKAKSVRFFSSERLREELAIIGNSEYETVVLCDSNFGMYDADEQFVEDLIKTKERYGWPRYIETSWAKVKSPQVVALVKKMKKAGIGSSVTFAMQSLNESVLRNMGRVNEDQDCLELYVKELRHCGVDCYGELIWGAPGESPASFIEGYDRLARHIPQIATYPMLLLPGTRFAEDRERYGLTVTRNDVDDFEYVRSHSTMSIADNRIMHRFLFWSRLLVENRILRTVWEAISEYLDIRQSRILMSLDGWIDKQEGVTAGKLRDFRDVVVNRLDASRISGALRYSYVERAPVEELLMKWWDEEISPIINRPLRNLFREVVRFDLATRPVYDPAGTSVNERECMREVQRNGEWYYVRDDVLFDFDVPSIVERIAQGKNSCIDNRAVWTRIYYKKGFADYIDNQEMIKQYIGAVELVRG